MCTQATVLQTSGAWAVEGLTESPPADLAVTRRKVAGGPEESSGPVLPQSCIFQRGSSSPDGHCLLAPADPNDYSRCSLSALLRAAFPLLDLPLQQNLLDRWRHLHPMCKTATH